ncbi:MAG: TetR/AcrR family transcriptional regulator [Actinomycetota bacterium]|nr:TetR/AcrR family transcriptional regulator [Actinomycetota bacterium]
MARPREFDEEHVLGLARDAFWSNGVAATSIADLSEATGLSVGSIYKAFGSKSGLCHRSLDQYLEAGMAELEAILDGADSPIAGIEAYLDAMARQASGDSATRGCFGVNCATELSETDDAVRGALRRNDARLVARLADAVRAAAAAGELSSDLAPVETARFLYTTVCGLQVEARKGIALEQARATVAMALRALR